MLPKVQTFGINKDMLIKVHQELLENIDSEISLSDEKLEEYRDFCVLQSKAMLFGVAEIAKLENRHVSSIIRRFGTDYEGLNQQVEKMYQNRNYEDISNWVVEILEDTREYLYRDLNSIPYTGTEKRFLEIISNFENTILKYFDKDLLPILESVEKQIKEELTKIYNNSSLSEDESIKLANEYLDAKESELASLFEKDIADELKKIGIEYSLLAIIMLGYKEPDKSFIDKIIRIFTTGYISNITAYWFNEIRRVKENVFDNIMQGANQRSLATEQLNQTNFNRNTYKLSVISHVRGLFRAMVADTVNTEYYKALVPPDFIESLNPKGVTVNQIFMVRTRDEWSKQSSIGNINVVNGLSLHHNDQIYYLPIKESELKDTKEISKKQREVFKKNI